MGELSRDVAERYRFWLESPVFDENTKTELRALAGNNQEIEDRFYRELEFGTGGLRGVLGAGINRMNVYTVRRATQGLADYITECTQKDSGDKVSAVAIAFASRTGLCI